MFRVLGLFAAVAILPACEPDDVPRFAPEGPFAAFLADAGRDPEKDVVPVGLVEIETGKVRKLTLSDGWSASGFVWIGSRLLVSSRKLNGKVDEKGKPQHDFAEWLLDPATGGAERWTLKGHVNARPFHGTHRGKRCLYVPQLEPERVTILELPGLKELGVLEGDGEAAGDGWTAMKDSVESANGLTRDVKAVRLLDPEGKEAGRIAREELAKASFRDARFPEIARVSDDRKRVLLGFDTSTIFRQMDAEYTFGVYDLAGGTLAYMGKSNALRGVPVLVGDVVYVLEAKSREIYGGERTVASLGSGTPSRSQPTSDIVLARHDRNGRKVVLDLSLGKESRATRYSASDDRKRFLLQVEGAAPRLLVIPVGDAVKADQVREIKLD